MRSTPKKLWIHDSASTTIHILQIRMLRFCWLTWQIYIPFIFIIIKLNYNSAKISIRPHVFMDIFILLKKLLLKCWWLEMSLGAERHTELDIWHYSHGKIRGGKKIYLWIAKVAEKSDDLTTNFQHSLRFGDFYMKVIFTLNEPHRIEIVLVKFKSGLFGCFEMKFQSRNGRVSYGTIKKVVWIAEMWLLISLELTSKKETDKISPIHVFNRLNNPSNHPTRMKDVTITRQIEIY